MTMANPFDRMIEAVAPVWGIRRAAARFALDQYRSYAAAKSSRRNDWAAPATSANAEIGPQVARIRAKARDLARNTELGANAVRRLSAHMVGTGIVPRLASEDAAERRAFTERFRAFSDHCDPEDMTDFGGKQLEVAQCVVESGTALMRFLPRPSGWRMRVPLQVQVLEPDYIDMSKNEIGNDGSIIIQGAEYDSWGRRVATWLFEEHPGDVWPLGAGRLKSRRFTMDEVRPVFHRLRPGQVWGVPWFFPVVTRMRDLADYEEAEHLRKLTEACFAVFIKRPPGSAQSPLIPGDGKKDAAGRSITKITPGMIKELGVGEEVTFSQPEPVAGAVDVLKHHMGVVAVGLGLPRHELTGDPRRPRRALGPRRPRLGRGCKARGQTSFRTAMMGGSGRSWPAIRRPRRPRSGSIPSFSADSITPTTTGRLRRARWIGWSRSARSTTAANPSPRRIWRAIRNPRRPGVCCSPSTRPPAIPRPSTVSSGPLSPARPARLRLPSARMRRRR
ncbi:phage portal protein [Paramagnetospirillum magneticum]|uniref:phage portal protein n=1 Tax=Paramagnetospirillum magneticum TaxID=84159 RepID=UPI0003260BA1|nr:phage portal protein [Paramagnetospirillum magneticum]